MNQLKEKLEWWAVQLMQEQMEHDCEYRLWRDRKEEIWSRFKEENPKAAVSAHINMTDLEGMMRERERYFLFWLGLRLGVTVGGVQTED